MAVPEGDAAALRHALDEAAHYLPAQGPIGVFVHHNTLHAFEHLSFDQALSLAAEKFGAEPFAPESEFRAAFARRRILSRDLRSVLEREQGEAAHEPSIAGATRLELLEHALHALEEEPSEAALSWQIEEGTLFERVKRECGERHDLQSLKALWLACEARFRAPRPIEGRAHRRLRDALYDATGQDSDSFVHPTLIRLCAAFLDQGVAYWAMPGRERGLFEASRTLLAEPGPPPNPWVRDLVVEMQRQIARAASAEQVALEQLVELGLQPAAWPDFVEATLLALPGWAGMIHQIELRPDRVPVHAPPTSLLDYFALRLSLENVAHRFIARAHGLPCDSLSELWTELHDRQPLPLASRGLGAAHDAFRVLARAGVRANDVLSAPEARISAIADELARFDAFARRLIWQRAYELRHAHQISSALAAHVAAPASAPSVRFQAVFCIDERAESLRRHLEEVCPAVDTLATAGFFGVAIYYQGIDDAHAIPLCPIAITPRHEVHEQVASGASARLVRRRVQRRIAGRFAQGAYVGSRTFVRGTIWSAALGMLSAVPLVLRVLFPRSSARIGQSVMDLSLPKLETRLALERHADERTASGRLLGFSTDEMTEIVAQVLEDMGLTQDFASIVLIVGHGSSSLNNPHESAHDCGACGGGRGGPNARAFAQMANHPTVREQLAARGIVIPVETWFVGAYHDTCNDAVSYFDLSLLPASHTKLLAELSDALDRARALDAHERCRRFESAGTALTPERALRHVEGRALDLAQPRPEYGHATNAVAVIGRRARTRGLFLDRRAFLISYDPSADQAGTLLARVLASVVPVGAGINLEYYFSYVDPVRFGCGTKLPHNITGLVGVMDGYSSDLRTGLPWQMVEIHEPVRLFTIIEAEPRVIADAVARTPAVARLVQNQWLRVAALDPNSAQIHWLDGGEFVPYTPESAELPVVERSASWYENQKGHLPPARVLSSSFASS